MNDQFEAVAADRSPVLSAQEDVNIQSAVQTERQFYQEQNPIQEKKSNSKMKQIGSSCKAIMAMIATFLVISLFIVYFRSQHNNQRQKFRALFDKYLFDFNITIPAAELLLRSHQFQMAELRIRQLRLLNLSWTPGHTGRSHLLESQINAILATSRPLHYHNDQQFQKRSQLLPLLKNNLQGLNDYEAAFDDSLPLKYRKNNLKNQSDFKIKCGPIRNQLNCSHGASYFAVVDFVSSLHSEFINYSAQYLIDCTTQKYFDSSRGGWMNKGCSESSSKSSLFQTYFIGLPLQTSYPYVGTDGVCNKDIKRVELVQNLFNYRGICNMLDYVGRERPVLFGFHATRDFLLFYKGGIYDTNYTYKISNCLHKEWYQFCSEEIEYKPNCSAPINSNAVSVGWGSNFVAGKHGLGQQWGEGGYFKLRKFECQMCQDIWLAFQ